jgi:hypothetical protein
MRLIGVAVGLLLTGAGALWAALPTTNPAGSTLKEAMSGLWTAADLKQPNAIRLQLGATGDESADTTNTLGATAYIGVVVPDSFAPTRARKAWLEIE